MIAVVIPHMNDVIRLQRCLTALMPQAGEADEVVVVDNGSTDSMDLIRESWPRLRIVNEAHAGAAHARNRGVTETTAPLLAFLDCDCLPAPNWLATARTVLNRRNAQLVGGRVEVFDEDPGPRSGAQAFEVVFAFDNRAYVERKGFSVTANLVTRRDVFDATGPFSPHVSEDLDWCRRATRAGFRIAYDDDLRVLHPTRANWLALSRKWHRLTEESFAIGGRRTSWRLAWAIRAILMPASVLAHAPRVLFHPTLVGAGERSRALATLSRLRLQRMRWMLAQAWRG